MIETTARPSGLHYVEQQCPSCGFVVSSVGYGDEPALRTALYLADHLVFTERGFIVMKQPKPTVQ